MEKDSRELDKNILANKKFGDFFTEGLLLFGRNYGKVILPFTIFLIISNILIVILLTELNWVVYEFNQSPILLDIMNRMTTDPESINETELLLVLQSLLSDIGILGLEGIIGAVFTVIAMCSVSKFLYKKYLYGKADFGKEFKKAFNKKMLLPIVIIGLCVPTGSFFLLYLPGIVIFYYFIFLIYMYDIKDLENPTKEARSIAKGNFWTIVGVFLASVIITTFINIPIQWILDLVWTINATTYSAWLNPNTRNYVLIFLFALSYDIVGILLAPLFICILTTLFATLKARYDLGYQKRGYSQRTGYREESTPYSSYPRESDDFEVAANVSEIKGGMYCPYCGTHITTPKKFCVKCGESLQFD